MFTPDVIWSLATCGLCIILLVAAITNRGNVKIEGGNDMTEKNALSRRQFR